MYNLHSLPVEKESLLNNTLTSQVKFTNLYKNAIGLLDNLNAIYRINWIGFSLIRLSITLILIVMPNSRLIHFEQSDNIYKFSLEIGKNLT